MFSRNIYRFWSTYCVLNYTLTYSFFSIDATEETGRLGRLLNHSKLSPNCITKVIQIEKQEKPRLVLIAKCDIEAGTELLYDYGDRSKESLAAHPWLAKWKKWSFFTITAWRACPGILSGHISGHLRAYTRAHTCPSNYLGTSPPIISDHITTTTSNFYLFYNY